MSDPVNQVKSAVASEVSSVKSKIAAFISRYKVHAIVGSGAFVAGFIVKSIL